MIRYLIFIIRYLLFSICSELKMMYLLYSLTGFCTPLCIIKKPAQCAICCNGILPETRIVKDAWNEPKI